ncbi:MAG: MATE family efflux transporter [Lachnospiraceae bacterium]
MNKDLTQGKPSGVLWLFCLPLFASVIFQQLYNIADSLVAGRCISENALAAVGNSYEITLIFIAFAFGCNMGCSIVAAQYFGAKRFEEMKCVIYTTLIFGAALCLCLMVLGLSCSELLLRLIHTPQELMADSLLYLRIYILGLPFLFFYNIATGIFSALGDSKTPFFFLAASSTANVLVDILFVKCLHMGIAGVAWATFLCQGISCVLAMMVVLRRLHNMKTERKAMLFSKKMLGRIISIAFPSFLQQSFISVGNVIIQTTINGYGPGIVAGYSAAIKLNNMIISALTTLGNGVSNFTAQNLGAGKLDRVKSGFLAALKMVWFICIPVVAIYLTTSKLLVNFFIKEPTELALETGKQFLTIISPFYFVVSVKLVADGILRGAGKMKAFMISTFTDLLLRVILALSFSSLLGCVGIWYSWPIGWIIGTVLSLCFVSVFLRKRDKNDKINFE